MDFEDNLSEIKILSIERSEPRSTWSRNTLINHLAAASPSKENLARDESEEEETKEIHEIEIEGVVYRRKSSMPNANNTTEVKVTALDFVLESAKQLEQENFDLREKLKFEEEKIQTETKEKVELKRQMLLQQKMIKTLERKSQNMLPQKKKSVVQQFQGIDKSFVKSSQVGNGKKDSLETFETNENDIFHGFTDEEIVGAVSSASKLVLNKLVMEEVALIDALENEIEETWKRSMLEKLILEEELDSSREWLEVEGIFDDV